MPTIVETKTCKQTGKQFDVLQEELDLLEQISPVLNGKKYLIPVSEYHPDVNHQRHLSWRNERTLYRGKCDLTGESLITNIHPDQGYTIYNTRDYRSDKREKMDYGVEVDTTKGFIEQFGAMFRAMPQMSLALTKVLDNCDFCNHGYKSKDCYMCTSPTWAEQCYYGSIPIKCLRDVDGYVNDSCQYTYQCIYSRNCYECQRTMYSNDCKHSSYLLDCNDCDYCFLCVNIIHQQYCIFNKQYTKATYTAKIQALCEQYTFDELYQQFLAFILTQPKRATRGKLNESGVGDLLYSTSNNYHCFYMQDVRDSYYCRTSGFQSSDLLRCDLSGLGSRMYDCSGTASSTKSAWCISSNTLTNCYYCFFCTDCQDCFGCVSLKHKKYCIFNKQYTEEEYENVLSELIEKMIEQGERGNFFHPSISYFPYNDTDAFEWFPEDKEVVLEHDWKWIDKEEKAYTGDVYQPAAIAVYQQDKAKQEELLAGTLVCEVTGKPFRIIQQELDFYLKFSIEIPRKHPDQRYKERIEHWRFPRKLFERTCAKTGVKIFTPYGPEREEEVWSEEVRDKEFLG